MINISDILVKGFILIFLFTLIVFFSSYYKYYENYLIEETFNAEFAASLVFITIVIIFTRRCVDNCVQDGYG